MSTSNMEYRILGRTGLKVSALSLGGWITFGGHVQEGMEMDSATLYANTAVYLMKD